MQIDLDAAKDDVAASSAMTTWDYSSQHQGNLHSDDQRHVPQAELYVLGLHRYPYSNPIFDGDQKLRTQR